VSALLEQQNQTDKKYRKEGIKEKSGHVLRGIKRHNNPHRASWEKAGDAHLRCSYQIYLQSRPIATHKNKAACQTGR
jgi:hypothetical protein